MQTDNAIKVITGRMLEISFEFDICKSVERVKRLEEEYNALTTARDALEYRRPARVLTRRITDDIKIRSCPRCNVRFIAYGMKYCGECGQALDWAEDGEKSG